LNRPDFIPDGATEGDVAELVVRLRANLTYETAIFAEINTRSTTQQHDRCNAIRQMIVKTLDWLNSSRTVVANR
jgi:hypothetical protein